MSIAQAGDRGIFTFFDLRTWQAKWKVSSQERIRVSRAWVRTVLLSGIDVRWSKTLSCIEAVDDGTKAVFDDGTSEDGSVLVGCDGANSKFRRKLYPSNYQNDQVPVRFIGASVCFEEPTISATRKLDSYFLQGGDPRTDGHSGLASLRLLLIQHRLGSFAVRSQPRWPYRPGFLHRADPLEMPSTKTGPISLMRHLAEDWVEPVRSIANILPQEAEFGPVEMADWPPRRSEGFGGRVMLPGDAAHSMVMYRGEGANHAIVDDSNLMQGLEPLYQDYAQAKLRGGIEQARKAYELEMIQRTEVTVLASRRACLDAYEVEAQESACATTIDEIRLGGASVDRPCWETATKTLCSIWTGGRVHLPASAWHPDIVYESHHPST